jgi:PIN domain nuclease of toxin-antitoxin system
MVILDTCAIIEACRKKPSFTSKVSKLMDKGSYILSISFAEIACKTKTAKLDMDVSLKTLYENFLKIECIKMVDVSTLMWLDSINIDWPDNRDPADRLIIAFAIKNNISVVTTDDKMKKFYKKIIW